MQKAILAVPAICILVFSGCGFNPEAETSGPLISDPVSIEAGNADRANVQLNMNVGEMKVRGGGSKLLAGTIEYNSLHWKPQFTTSHNGDHATVTVRQPEGENHIGNVGKNQWDLQLANRILLDLSVNCGAGEAKLDLGDVKLRDLQVRIGVGQVDLDLTGKPQRDYQVTIHGGIGEANIRLPQGVGIYATAHGGIGSIDVTGLEKRGDHWENDLYDKAKVNVRVEVNGGIGEIRLIG